MEAFLSRRGTAVLNPSKKEIARMFYVVKGHLVDERTMQQSYDSYFQRMWGNHELCYHEEGFEEAYEEYLNEGRRKAIMEKGKENGPR
jgi:hypothetical protein